MARTRQTTVKELAQEADIDLDEVLVTLWEFGFDQLADENAVVAARDVRAARAALGLEDSRASFTVDYWIDRSGLTRAQLTERLKTVGVTLAPDVRRIPKNSLRRLRSMFGNGAGEVTEAPELRVKVQPVDPLKWRQIGNTAIKRYLEEDEIAAIHEALTKDFVGSGDPISPPGVKDHNLLSSACHRPRTGLGENLKYPTAEMSAAALFHSVVQNHAFHNGNKRTGLVALLAVLDENGLVLTCSQEDLFKFTLKTAQHGLVPAHADQIPDREVQCIAYWIRSNTRAVSRYDRPMRWHRLKSRLAELGCEMEPAGGVGNRLNIRRTVPRRGLFGRRRTEVLPTQVAWAGDNTECDRNTIHKIRVDLELDDAHDVDSSTFYEGTTIDGFIIEYRRILRRLARL